MKRWTAWILTTAGLLAAPAAAAQEAAGHGGGEASLKIPDLNSVQFLGAAIPGHTLLLSGLAVCALGLLFGLVIYSQLKRLPVHESMREVSELIYETCKTYLLTQGKFLMLLWVIHRRHRGSLFRSPSSDDRRLRCGGARISRVQGGDHSVLQSGRNWG